MSKNYIDSKESRQIECALAFSKLLKRSKDKPDYTPWVITQDYLTVRNLARRLSSVDTSRCNGTRYQDDRFYEAAINKIYDSLNYMLRTHGIQWYHQSDPRGASLYLSLDPLTDISYSHGLALV